MKIVRSMAGKPLRDMQRSEDRISCQIENVNDWVISRNIEGDDESRVFAKSKFMV